MNVIESISEAMNRVPTKRNVLKTIAGIYDPIGFMQPLVLNLKILFRKICLSGAGWDVPLSDDLQEEWYSMLQYMKQIGELIVPRCYCLNLVTDPVVNVELHGFSDPSEIAYAGCVYLKSVTRSGCTKVSLVTAKSRIVPNSKAETIPRLELLGSLVLSKLMASVVVALDNELPVKKVFCWTDSTIALSWIKAVSKEFKTFVQNRVSIIRKNVNENQ